MGLAIYGISHGISVDGSAMNRAMISILIGAVLISTSAPWVKVAQVAPSTAGFYRMLIGGVCLLLICLIQKRQVWAGLSYLLRLSPAAFFFALDLAFWHRSIHMIGPGLATILANLQVFCLALIGFLFFKEKISVRFMIGLVTAFSGVFILIGLDWSQVTDEYQQGVLYGVLTALSYTGFLLTMRRSQIASDSMTPLANLAIVSLLCMIFLASMVAYEGNSFAIPDLRSGLALLALGVLCQVIGWLLITRAMPSLPASIVGVVLLLQPALSMVWDVIFFNRPTSQLDIIGSLMVLVGIYLASRLETGSNPPQDRQATS